MTNASVQILNVVGCEKECKEVIDLSHKHCLKYWWNNLLSDETFVFPTCSICCVHRFLLTRTVAYWFDLWLFLQLSLGMARHNKVLHRSVLYILKCMSKKFVAADSFAVQFTCSSVGFFFCKTFLYHCQLHKTLLSVIQLLPVSKKTSLLHHKASLR